MKSIFKINNSLIRLILLILLFSLSQKKSSSQSIIVQNPGEYLAIEALENALNSLYEKEIKTQTSISTIQNTIEIEFSQIKDIEKAYTNYLQDASFYATSLKASSSLIDDGVIILNYLSKISKEIKESKNNAICLFKIDNLLKEATNKILSLYTFYSQEIALGGKDNMLSGYERSKLLLELSKNLSEFKRKLEKIYYSLKVRTLNYNYSNLRKSKNQKK